MGRGQEKFGFTKLTFIKKPVSQMKQASQKHRWNNCIDYRNIHLRATCLYKFAYILLVVENWIQNFVYSSTSCRRTTQVCLTNQKAKWESEVTLLRFVLLCVPGTRNRCYRPRLAESDMGIDVTESRIRPFNLYIKFVFNLFLLLFIFYRIYIAYV